MTNQEILAKAVKNVLKTSSTPTDEVIIPKHTFQWYDGAKNSQYKGELNLQQLIRAIHSPKKANKELLDKIQLAATTGDLEQKRKLKEKLPAFTPAVMVTNRRRISDIINYTGLAVLDFDGIDYAPEFKEFLFDTYKSIICCWISPSQKGVKAIVSIPLCNDIDEFRDYSYGLASVMEQYNGYDRTTNNPVLPLFIGEDTNILVREDYTTWTVKGDKINTLQGKKKIKIQKLTDEHDIEWILPNGYNKPDLKPLIIKIYSSSINKIENNGHPQLRDASVALGGYVSQGYIEYDEAIALMEELVENNEYLSKGIYGYQQTGKQAIDYGIDYPIELF